MRFVYVLNKRYKVFEDGTIVSCCRKKEKVLKPQLKSNGYLEVALFDGNKYIYRTIHRLVAICFIHRPNKHLVVNHKDYNKLNNKVNNLEWVTQKDNIIHKINTIYKCEHKDGEIVHTRNLKEFAQERGLSQGCLNEVYLGKNGRKQHKGWRVITSDSIFQLT